MNRRERKKEETRNTIVECALSFFREKGFYETSMEEIAEKSDVSKGTLYNYFPDKESILIVHFQSSIQDYGKEIKTILKDNPDIESRLNKLLDFKNYLYGHDKELTSIYFRYRLQKLFDSDPFNNPQRSGLENLVLEIITDGQKSGKIRYDIPTLTIARTFLLMTANYFISNLYLQDSDEAENLKQQLIGLFLNGAKQ